MGNPRRKLLVYVGIILCLNAVCCLGSKYIKSPARILAERAGATQFKESIEDDTDHLLVKGHHGIVKRLAEEIDDDSDYEVYQGVVGRAGIDFPVLTGIPATNFNCRKVGNGYFADLETECQVFHICDSGRKISFLCPNGTIFKQTELICDWWFKVDCSKSPGHYSDSAEILSRGQERRRHPTKSSRVEYNIRAPARRVKEERKQERPTSRNPTYNSRSQYKSSEENSGSLQDYSNESYDFEDESPEVIKPVSNNIRKPSRKFQETSEQKNSRGTSRPRGESNTENNKYTGSTSFGNAEDEELSGNRSPSTSNFGTTTFKSHEKSSQGTLRPRGDSNTETQEFAESASFVNPGSDDSSSSNRSPSSSTIKSRQKASRGTLRPHSDDSTNRNPSTINFGSSTHQTEQKKTKGTLRPSDESYTENENFAGTTSFIHSEFSSSNKNPSIGTSTYKLNANIDHRSTKGTLRPREESNTENENFAGTTSFINSEFSTSNRSPSSVGTSTHKTNQNIEHRTTKGTLRPREESRTENQDFAGTTSFIQSEFSTSNRNPTSTHNAKHNHERKGSRGTLRPHGESNTETQEFAESASFVNSGANIFSSTDKISSTYKSVQHNSRGTLRPHEESNTEVFSTKKSNPTKTHIRTQELQTNSNTGPSVFRIDLSSEEESTTNNLQLKDVKTTKGSKTDFSTETQEVAESASFIQGNGYKHQQSVDDNYGNRNSYNSHNDNNSDKKYRNDDKYSSVKDDVKMTTVQPTTYSRRGSSRFNNDRNDRHERKFTTARARDALSLTTSTPSFDNEHSYTTAKRLGTTKDAPFYTPTVPTLINRVQTFDINSNIEYSSTTTQSTPSEHAIEMIKMLKNLEAMPTPETEKHLKGSRPGLNIPPSSGPDTLHSLALYFATAVDTYAVKQNTTVDLDDLPQELKDQTEAAIATALLSNKTVNKYDQLFGKNTETTTEANILNSRLSADDIINDLTPDYSKNPILSASGTPQVRELAQVFTHALSAYLHDPETFRRILSDIRPTEPPQLEINDLLTNRVGRTEIDKTGSTPVSTNGATYLPKSTTPISTQQTTTTDDFEVLDFSDVTLSTLRRETTDSINDMIQSTTDIPKDYITSTDFNSMESTTTDFPTNTIFNIVKTPASDLIAGKLDVSSNTVQEEKIISRSSFKGNPLAAEINVGLLLSTMYPYISGDSVEKDSTEGSNYFPVETKKIDKTLKPYGHDVKPLNSTPINTPSSIAKNLSDLWGGRNLIDGNDVLTTTTDFPFLSSDLLPPSVINANINADISLPDGNLLPPTAEEGTTESDEQLQKAQSQSFVASRNTFERKGKKIADAASINKLSYLTEQSTATESSLPKTSIKGHFITEIIPTEEPSTSTTDLPKTTYSDASTYSQNPWASLAYTVFLDPLTINDGLMDSGESSSAIPSSPTTFYDKSYNNAETTTSATISTTSDDFNETTTNYESTNPTVKPTKLGEILRRGKSIQVIETESRFDDIDNSLKELMQERANEMFGELNETSAHSLMNVMKKADENKTVKRLILLLIQTCDDDFNKTVEDSRQALLNALIGMDDNDSEIKIINTRINRKNVEKLTTTTTSSTTTTTDIPITTYKSNSHEQYISGSSEILSTTISTTSGESTTTNSNDYTDETTKTESRFRIDLSEEYDTTTTTTTLLNNPSTQFYSSDSGEYSTIISTTLTDDLTTSTTITDIPITTTEITQQTEELLTNRKGKSLERYLSGDEKNQLSPTLENGGASKHSDARALELLKSLYSLASKWSKR